jgi:hypothetical protein
MQIQDLARAYGEKTDDELLYLAQDAKQLTSEGQLALASELSRRRLKSPANTNLPTQHEPQVILEQENLMTPASVSSMPRSAGEFVRKVVSVYHGNFWFFARLIAPAVTAGYLALMLSRHETREIARHLPRGIEMLTHKTEIIEMWVANLAGYVVSWLAFCLSFGAICVGVDGLMTGVEVAPSDCFVQVRRRIAPFLRLSLVLFLLCAVGMSLSGFLSARILWASHRYGVHPSHLIAQVLSFSLAGLFLLALSRFGLAMPALIIDHCTLAQALFRSDELTEGKWTVLAILLAKSLIGGYVAGMLPFWLAGWLWPYLRLPGWSLSIASVAAVIAIEPYMFIGFAMMYTMASTRPSTHTSALAQQFA